MEIELVVTGDPESMRSLEAWLTGEFPVRPVVAAPRPGTMGAVADVLMVGLGQGGAAAALAGVLVSWIRRQAGKVSVAAKRPDGAEVTLTAENIRGLTTDEVSALVTKVTTALDSTDTDE
jgi:hypothetical protein